MTRFYHCDVIEERRLQPLRFRLGILHSPPALESSVQRRFQTTQQARYGCAGKHLGQVCLTRAQSRMERY